jgi:putative FmdB family regulatory protein
MPTYEYRCPLGHEFERFQKMSDPVRVKCPTCGRRAERQISGGAGLIFKGSGFYITDYGKDGKGAREKEPSGKSEPAASDSTAAKSEPAESKAEPAEPKGKTKSSGKSEKPAPRKKGSE